MTLKITPENATAVIGKVMMPDVYPITVDLARSSGSRIYDSRGNRFYLDCFSYIASNPIGQDVYKRQAQGFDETVAWFYRSVTSG